MSIEQIIKENENQCETPYFLYFYDVLKNTTSAMLNAITENANLLYSIKANPNKSIIKFMEQQGIMFEVASEGELYHILSCGIDGKKIVFSGQGKTKSGIKSAIENGVLVINVESIRELKDIRTISKELNKSIKVILRINPSFDNQESALQMGGVPSSYGIDEEQLFELLDQQNSDFSIDGLFMYLGTNYHEHKYIVKNTEYLFNLAEKVYKDYGIKFEFLDFGGGFGIPEFDTDTELDLVILKQDLVQIFKDKLKLPCFSEIKNLFFESGRYLVARCGVLVTKVLDVKVSRGVKYVILNGGINCLGIKQMEYRRVEPHLELVQNNHHDVDKVEEVCIVGTTCTPIDVTHQGICLYPVEIDDYIYFNECGAYIYEFSPKNFCGQVSLAEYMYKENKVYITRKRGDVNSTYGDLFMDIDI